MVGPDDEWRAISLNYTSGTTGNPKGVVYHHRGAYLNALSNVVGWNLAHHPSTCGPCRCSTATDGASRGRWRRSAGQHLRAQGGAGAIYEAIAGEGVTHLCGAPVVLG